MSMTSALIDLDRCEYVLLTSYRRTGAPVSTPVWAALGDGELLVSTGATSGKVKRFRHTPRVTLAPCDARGRELGAAAPVEATATIRDDAATRDRLDRALTRKYKLKYKLLRAGRALSRSTSDSVVLVLS